MKAKNKVQGLLAQQTMWDVETSKKKNFLNHMLKMSDSSLQLFKCPSIILWFDVFINHRNARFSVIV